MSTKSRILPPPGAILPAKVVPIPPNQTLYVRNLPSNKIKKDDLRMALYLLFSAYGPVLDVVALKTMKMRGQAHVVFRDVQAATQALRSLDGSSFFGFNLKIAYARSKSNVISRLDGTFEPPTAAQTVQVTELQHSIFNAPAPGAAAAVPAAAAKPKEDEANRGQKRSRDEEDSEDSDVAMEEDSDDE